MDQDAIRSEQEYAAALRTVEQQRGEPGVLHAMMNRLESYRQQRKWGWSRPWNKYGVRTFQSFRLRKEDGEWLDRARELLREMQPTANVMTFVDDLLRDPNWMGFLFYSELLENGALYESVTLGFGRKAKGSPRQRDRLDIVWDIPLRPGKDHHDARLRVFVDPLREEDPEPLWRFQGPLRSRLGESMLLDLARLSWQWQDCQERCWNHWTSRYIDYFGERRYRPDRCYFYLEGARPRWSDAPA